MIQYNAIIAMEDLNYGFKRGRFKVERQVYQKFENMLINKLNYLVDKRKNADEAGGVLKGYQLTYIPERLKNMGRQCGIIFYVPAAYTSKIDPTTGFVNLFNFNAITSQEDRKKFISKFKHIRYNSDMSLFEFEFDYKDFITHNTQIAKTDWIVYTNGPRIKKERVNGKWNEGKEVDITEVMKQKLSDNGIHYADGCDILTKIAEADDKLVSEIFQIFRLTVQLRNSKSESSGKDYDRIISPVLNESNGFYDSDEYNGENEILPVDADANGAYCIALKGLYEVKQIRENWVEGNKFSGDLLKISNADWFDFIQNKRYE